MSNVCSGNTEDHCCYLRGKPCPHLEQHTMPDRKWVCGLRRKLGDWDKVLESEEYLTDVAPVFEPLGINCRDWPEPTGCGNCNAD